MGTALAYPEQESRTNAGNKAGKAGQPKTGQSRRSQGQRLDKGTQEGPGDLVSHVQEEEPRLGAALCWLGLGVPSLC